MAKGVVTVSTERLVERLAGNVICVNLLGRQHNEPRRGSPSTVRGPRTCNTVAMQSSAERSASGERIRYDQASLLDAVVQVFNERGYDGTRMEHLAKAAGVSKSAFYYYFTGKEELLRLALQRATEPVAAVILEEGSTSGSAIARLEHVLRRWIEIIVHDMAYVTLLLRVHGNTETERWAIDQRRTFDSFVDRLVVQAMNEGDLRADMDSGTVTRLILGMINTLVEWFRAAPRDDRPIRLLSISELQDTVVGLAFDGVRSR
ncbi:MAG: hypothetical protein QOH17_2846 [Pseudonocardiales bacterium]|jgi:AcrR family transcriptional regulator|nr:hypothetical protein [Pseudonocardiales bacterium]